MISRIYCGYCIWNATAILFLDSGNALLLLQNILKGSKGSFQIDKIKSIKRGCQYINFEKLR